MPVMQGSEIALLDAVAAGHTTRVVHLMGLEIDARCFAVLGTQAARLALVGIKIDLEP